MDYVLITGATSGIGKEFARYYASAAKNLIIVGRNRDRLDGLKMELERKFPIEVVIITLDLASQEAFASLARFINESTIDVSLVINNAGIATSGPAEQVPSKRDYEMVMVNIYSLMEITKLFLDYFYQRNKGAILNVASTGAYAPGPFTASYFASKSFVLSYTQALNFEAKANGVYVGVLCPGTTATNLFQASNQKCPRWAMDPAKVARIGARQINREKPVQICGWTNQLLTMLPKRIKVSGIARIKKNGSTEI